jgi:hypothetical protein
MIRITIAIATLAVVGMTPGCGAVEGPPGGFVTSGTVVGPMAAAGPVAIIWAVDSSPSDYAYKFGDGTATATTFTAALPSDPPTNARSHAPGADLGVGILALLPPGASLPEGMTSSLPAAVGYSRRYAVIYRGTADTGTVVPWTAAFPIGLSCGRCVDSMTGFDTFEPVDCAMLLIDTDSTSPGCNWT